MFDSSLTAFCGSSLWDDKALYSPYPDFTWCFQYTLLIWTPCLILWLIMPFWVYMLTRSQTNRIKVSWILILKTIFLLILSSLEVYNYIKALLSQDNRFVYCVTPVVLILTYGLALLLTHYERIRGLKSSTLLFVFWISLTLAELIRLRSKIINHYFLKVDKDQDYEMYLFFAYIGMLLMIVVLSLIPEKVTPIRKIVRDDILDESNTSHLKLMPENHVSLLSQLSFWWINDLINTGYKRDLTREDLWRIDDCESSDVITKKLESVWNPVAKEYILKAKTEKDNVGASSPKAASKVKYLKSKDGAKSTAEEQKLTTGDDDGEAVSFSPKKGDKKATKSKKDKSPSFALCLIRAFGGKFVAGSLLKLTHDMLLFAGPIILDKLITFIKDKEQNIQIGIFYAILLFLCSLIQSFVLQHYFHRMFVVGARIRTAIMNIVYRKSMRLSTSARKMATVGEMTNLVAVNAQTLGELTAYLNILWSAPLQIFVSMFLLWKYLGVASVIGLLSILVLIPLNIIIGNKIKKIQLIKMKTQDSRIKMMNEILSGIKVIKFYGWELSFRDLIASIRGKELGFLKKMNLLSISSSFLWQCAPLILTIVSFGSFILLNDADKFTANVVFVSLSLFNILRFPLTVLPMIISSLISSKVSIERISSFLLRDEIDDDAISFEDIPNVAVKCEKVDLGWDEKECLLKNIDLEVTKGQLVAIVGQVGSGKSSLICGLLGEMNKLNKGVININGKTAYVPQQAWIQNATVRNNILFGNKYDEKRYNQVVAMCSLETDLNIMPAGDQTEIGEKGINLSGGQKQRISLARALYSNAEIYMLDDPLSAVDAHVGKAIFDNVIGPSGVMGGKTRLFVTNSMSYLPQCNQIIMLDGGNVSEMGTYDQLLKKNGTFADFIRNYLANRELAASKQEESMVEAEGKTNADDKASSAKTPAAAESASPNGKTTSDAAQTSAAKSPVSNKSDAGAKIIQKEKIETGKVKLAVFAEYLKACGPLLMISFVVIFFLSNFLSIASNLWLSKWTTMTEKEKDDESKFFRLLIFIAIGFGQCVTNLGSDFVFLVSSLSSASKMHSSMLFSILRSTMEFFESTPSGRIINRFSKDIDAIERNIPESFKTLIRCVFHVLFTVLVISYSTPLFVISLVPLFIIYIVAQRYFVASMRQLKRMESASKSPIFSHFSESLTGTSSIRAYRVEKRFIRSMGAHIDESLLFYFPNNVSNRWLALRLELIGNLVSVFAALFAVFARDTISAGLAGLSISYSLNVSQTLNWLVRMSAEFETNITSVERIDEYCHTPHEKEWINETTKPAAEWPQKGHIQLADYSVKYREDLENVLVGLNADIGAGEKIGIVGRTGAGKSSIALGLFRILEKSTGTIRIDNVDIKTIGLHQLRHKLTIIPQDPVIFSGTIRMNLDPFTIYKDEQLWNALEHAHLKDFVTGLSKQLQFECTEGGENLSVGQRQLICLARALLRKTKILILDEATASVDHNTDDLIQNTIRKKFLDCTVLTVAHRLNTIMDSSRILVLDKGKIVEFDPPEKLLKNTRSVFYSMAKDAGLI